jgi:hypothetical protein
MKVEGTSPRVEAPKQQQQAQQSAPAPREEQQESPAVQAKEVEQAGGKGNEVDLEA